jgi:hypothetical protein
VIEDNEEGLIFGDDRQGFAAGLDPLELEPGEAILINFVLQIIVFDDQDLGLCHENRVL